MSFRFSLSDIVIACKLAPKIYRTIQYQKDLEAASLELRNIIETIIALHNQRHQTCSHIPKTCGQQSGKSIQCDQGGCSTNSVYIRDMPRDLQQRLHTVLSKMHETLLIVQEITESYDSWERDENPDIFSSIFEACHALRGLYTLLGDSVITDSSIERSGQDDCQNPPARNGDRNCRWYHLTKAIERCEIYRDETEISLSTAEQETSMLGRYKTNLFKRSIQQAERGGPNYVKSTQLTAVMLLCSIATPLLHWTLLKSLLPEPKTPFDKKILRDLPFLGTWIQIFEPRPTLSLILLLLSIALNVGLTFTLATTLHKSERPPVYVCTLFAIILGAFSQDQIGFSTLEYFLVFLPFLLAVGAGVGILFHRWLARLRGQRDNARGQRSSTPIGNYFGSGAGTRHLVNWCIDHEDDIAQGRRTEWQQGMRVMDEKLCV